MGGIIRGRMFLNGINGKFFSKSAVLDFRLRTLRPLMEGVLPIVSFS